jgi:hypothetical protein
MTQKDNSDNKKDEEFWNLRNIGFVEDVRSVPVGRVLRSLSQLISSLHSTTPH